MNIKSLAFMGNLGNLILLLLQKFPWLASRNLHGLPILVCWMVLSVFLVSCLVGTMG